MSPPTLAQMLASAVRQRITKYVDVASLALLVVDYLGTMEEEIRLVWFTDWSFAKALFFLSRYLAFFDVPLAIYYHTSLGLSPRTCQILFSVESVSLLVGVALAEAILFLRVYALSGRNFKLMLYLIFQYAAVHIAEAALYAKFLSNLQFTKSPLPTVIGCIPQPPKSHSMNIMLSSLFGLILANELIILFITSSIGLMKYRNLKSPIMKICYRDGLFYFLVLSAVSLGNIIADLTGSPEYRFLLVIFQRVIHSILSTRMILHMRDATRENVNYIGSAQLTEPHFARNQPQKHQRVNIDTFPAYKGSASSITEDIPITDLSLHAKKYQD